MKRIGSLLAMALVAAIPAGLQGRNPPPALPLDLNTIEERGAALDGQWVEFQAYVLYLGHYEPHRIFAVPGEAARRPDGSSHIECTGTRATNLPVILRGGTGPLRRRELLPAREGSTRYRMARIRAVFHKSRYLITLHPASLEYPAYFDRATIVEALNQWCDFPEPPPS